MMTDFRINVLMIFINKDFLELVLNTIEKTVRFGGVYDSIE